MGALPALLMCVHFSASPACSACRSVQLLAVKWPDARWYKKEKTQLQHFLSTNHLAWHQALLPYVTSSVCTSRKAIFSTLHMETNLLYVCYSPPSGAVFGSCTWQDCVLIWWFPVWGHICIYSFSQSQSGVCLNSLGQGHPRSAAYQTTDWHQGWMCHPHCHSAAQLSVQLEFFTPSWHCRASRLTKLLSVRAHLTFQVKGWSFGLIWFINHGRSCNESELILKKTKPYLGIACAGSVANAAAVSTCWFLAPVCGGLTAFKFS